MAEGHHGGFWTTLPGLLTGLAALITALTGAAIFLSGGDGGSTPAPGPAPVPVIEKSIGGGETPSDEPLEPSAPVSEPVNDPVADQVRTTAAVLNAMMPQQLDLITTRTGVSAEGRTIIFHHNVAQRTGPDDAVRAFVHGFACNDASIRDDLDRLGVTYRMSYNFPDSPQPLDVDVTSASCAGRY